ncbi:putative protein OS=Streptomyces fumanus OX=67302 GN=GCM10018772_05060 PE=4 SV=1 [Streptomyces fumanus]
MNRKTVDMITSDELDALYNRLDRLRSDVTALRDDLLGITGARWIADSLTTILDKEQLMPEPTCTASIEGPHVLGGGTIHCTREAGHPGNHVGPKRDDYGKTLWTHSNAGATPHRESSGEQPST